MINYDKRKFSICIVKDSEKDTHYKHFDSKKPNHCEFGYLRGENLTTCKMEDGCCENCIHWQVSLGVKDALKEAQRLANKTGKKVMVLTSAYNVYPQRNCAYVNSKDICNIVNCKCSETDYKKCDHYIANIDNLEENNYGS